MKLLLIIPLLLSSCVYADKSRAVALGGKGAYKGRDFGLIWDAEKSFQDGAIAATAVAGAVISAGASKAQEVTTRQANANATNQAINANNNATGLEHARLSTGLETTKATVKNPNVP